MAVALLKADNDTTVTEYMKAKIFKACAVLCLVTTTIVTYRLYVKETSPIQIKPKTNIDRKEVSQILRPLFYREYGDVGENSYSDETSKQISTSTVLSNAIQVTNTKIKSSQNDSTLSNSEIISTGGENYVNSPNDAYCSGDKSSKLLIYDITSQIKEKFQCVKLTSEPYIPVCLYDDKIDKLISREIKVTGAWERHIIEKFKDILSQDRKLGVIDLGANIGYYSLISAAMGHNVVAVEPNIDSIRRLQKSAQLAKTTSKITVLQSAVAAWRSPAGLMMNPFNQGDTRVFIGKGTSSSSVNTITLDDILEIISFDKAIIKVDVQGYEHQAFTCAEKLFNQVNITHVFMEWVLMRTLYIHDKHTSVEKTLVERMIWFFVQRDYEAYSVVNWRHLNPYFWYTWPEDIVWKK